jgi:plastocyanin
MRRLALIAALALAAAPAAAHAQHEHGAMAMASGPMVSIGFDAFSPQVVDVVTGDTVTWTNDSSRPHDVTATDAAWDSGRMVSTVVFSHRFDAPGVTHYYCRIHPFMTGEIAASDLLLETPAAPAGPNRPYPISGRSALPSGTPVAIEADTGAGFAQVATTNVEADGTFAANVVPTTTSALRAVAGDTASPVVQLLVLDHSVELSVRRLKGHRLSVDATVTPAAPGSEVVLQLHLMDRFGWWPVRTLRLDSRSHARFLVRQRARVPARVALTLPDGATILATSRTHRRY